MLQYKTIERYEVLKYCIMLIVLSSLIVPLAKNDSFAVVVLLGTGLLGIALLALLNKNFLGELKFKKRYLVPFEIFGGSFLINGAYFGVVGYIAIGLIFCAVMPLVYRVLSCHSTEAICRAIAKGVIYSFIIFCVLSLLFGMPLDRFQYFAFVKNPNIVGSMSAITTAAALYLIQINKVFKRKVVLYCFVIGVATSICYLSYSRTSLSAILLQIIIVGFVEFIKYMRDEDGRKLLNIAKNIIIFILIVIISFLGVFISLTTVKLKIEPYVEDVQEVLVIFDDYSGRNPSGKVSLLECIGLSNDYLDKGIEEQDMVAFTSGRTLIWEDYLKNTSFMGHSKESRDIDIGYRVYDDTNAHNVYIQAAYSAGIVAGIAIFVIVAMTGIELLVSGVKFLFKKTVISNETMFLISAFFVFGISSMTSAGYMIFTYLPATLFWLLFFIIMIKKDEIKNV